nr:MAG TPA: hypothetical protein [Caudoviricetes sp.]
MGNSFEVGCKSVAGSAWPKHSASAKSPAAKPMSLRPATAGGCAPKKATWRKYHLPGVGLCAAPGG